MLQSLTVDLKTCLESGIKPSIPKGTPLFDAAKKVYAKNGEFSLRFNNRAAFLKWVASPDGKNLKTVQVVSLFRRVKVPSEKCIRKPSCRRAVQNSCQAISRATRCNRRVRVGCGIRNASKIRKASNKIANVLAKTSNKNVKAVSKLVKKEIKAMKKLGAEASTSNKKIVKKVCFPFSERGTLTCICLEDQRQHEGGDQGCFQNLEEDGDAEAASCQGRTQEGRESDREGEGIRHGFIFINLVPASFMNVHADNQGRGEEDCQEGEKGFFLIVFLHFPTGVWQVEKKEEKRLAREEEEEEKKLERKFGMTPDDEAGVYTPKHRNIAAYAFFSLISVFSKKIDETQLRSVQVDESAHCRSPSHCSAGETYLSFCFF